MPDLLHHLGTLSMLVFLVCSMLASGMSLTLTAILAPLRDIRLVLMALVLNFLFAPALAWLLTVGMPLERGHAIGLLLLGVAAGAPFLPKLVEAARGDQAIAASLMTLLTVGTILLMPFALPVMVPGLKANPWGIARPLLLFILLPFAVGVWGKSQFSALAARVAPAFAKIGTISLVIFFALLVALNSRALLGVVGSGAILAAALYVGGLFIVGWVFGGSQREARTALSLGTAARNFGAALAPVGGNFPDSNVPLMILVSAVVGVVLSFGAARWVRYRTLPATS